MDDGHQGQEAQAHEYGPGGLDDVRWHPLLLDLDLEKVLERMAMSEHTTPVIKRDCDGKMRVTSSGRVSRPHHAVLRELRFSEFSRQLHCSPARRSATISRRARPSARR